MFRQKDLSKDFIIKIINQAAGKVPQDDLEDFLSLLEKEIRHYYFTNSSESNLLRIIQNQFDIGLFIKECLKYPHQIEILVTIANNSNYLSDILVRNPEYFFWIINPSTINQTISKKYYSGLLINSLSTFKTFESKVIILRNFKRKEILRIGLKDIYLKNDLKIITEHLSNLAFTISSELFNLCYNEVLSKHKIEKVTNRYVLFSLGKLGGNELNYSSDIDLIAFYDKNTLIDRKIYYNQILSETILLFIESASKKTGSGFLYRVDFRLRPDGRNAPLCGSYTEYLRYYEARGEYWERQMLIKANFLCGSKFLFNKFYNYVSKFIYPSSFSIPPTEQIKKLKFSIEKRNNAESNIKFTPGGIRDIEFSLQALQLVNGGKDYSIHTGNSLKAIKKLKLKSMISKKESSALKKSYILYRKVEHFLQLMNDQQTHTVPESGEIVEKIAHYLKFKDLESFKIHIKKSKNTVQKIFNSIMESEESASLYDQFDEIDFTDQTRARKNLEFLRTGKSLFDKKQFDSRAFNSFEKLEAPLFKFLSDSTDPDLVLENFVRVIKYASFPKIWYDEFSDENFFSLFLQLCEHSQKTIDLFAEDKILRDDFLSRDCLLPLDKIDFSKFTFTLKSFLFRASVQLVSKGLQPNLFPELLTNFIKQNIKNMIEAFSSDKKWRSNFFVAGMGSFGAVRLTFSSDVDLIFVIQDISNFIDVQKDFQKLLQILKDNFRGLEIDCRLRPEGKSSLLVWDINNYKRYFSSRARIWELQAFTKCRLIYGSSKLFDKFIKHYIKTVEEKEKDQIKTDIKEMRKKLLPINKEIFNVKKSFGGLMDIDFMITYLFLLKPSLIFGARDKSILEAIDVIEKNNKINFRLLKENFSFLKKVELINQNILNTKTAKVPTDEKKLLKLSKVLGFENSASFLLELNNITNRIRKEYQNVFN